MLNNIFFILLGAGLVSVGFFAAAVAERIRGTRVPRAAKPCEQPIHAQEKRVGTVEPLRPTSVKNMSAPALHDTSILGGKSAKLLHPAAATQPPRASYVAPKDDPSPGEDVIAALVAAGYKKPVATQAVWACGATERITVEGWTTSALRRCARGGMS